MFSDVLSQVIENIVKENFKAVVYKVYIDSYWM